MPLFQKETPHAFSLPSASSKGTMHILYEQEGKIQRWTLPEFEKEMEITYILGLEFASAKIFKKVRATCAQAKKRGDVLPQEIWLGSVFEKEILEGKVGALYLRWIKPHIGYGLFAAEDLPKGYYVGEYAGVVRPFSQRKDAKNCYCFEYKIHLGGASSYTIDAQDKGNLVRFINHNSSSNLTPQLAFCNGLQHVVLLTNQPVAKGCELTYDYGPTYWSKREMPLQGRER